MLALPSIAFEEVELREVILADAFAAALARSISKCFSVFKDNARPIKSSARLFSRRGGGLYHNSYSKLS